MSPDDTSTAPVPAPGEHGGDGPRLAAALGVDPADVLDLSQSLNPFAPDAAPLVERAADQVARYPDATGATVALAAALGADPDRVLLTNGGAEAIALVAAELPVGRVDEPDFSLYARHLREVRAAGARWRSNPHNPTGRLAGDDEHADVWDEAFFPLAAGRWTRGDVGSIVVGSLTKVFACPGLRMGYVIAPDPDLVERLRARQPQWSVGSIACAVLPHLLERADLGAWSRGIAKLRDELVTLLYEAGLRADPSDAPFVLVRDAAGVRDRLARHGVLVRDTSSFGLTNGIRVAVPGADGLERLAGALAASPDHEAIRADEEETTC
jgi:histidinol-phosphate/aromatic aminotransferase/cobyric acid decarboxylase-like protein